MRQHYLLSPSARTLIIFTALVITDQSQRWQPQHHKSQRSGAKNDLNDLSSKERVIFYGAFGWITLHKKHVFFLRNIHECAFHGAGWTPRRHRVVLLGYQLIVNVFNGIYERHFKSTQASLFVSSTDISAWTNVKLLLVFNNLTVRDQRWPMICVCACVCERGGYRGRERGVEIDRDRRRERER